MDTPPTLPPVLATLLPLVAFLSLSGSLWAIRGDFRRLFRRSALVANGRRLSARCAKPFPALAVLALLIAPMVFTKAAPPTTGIRLPSLSDVILSSLTQGILFGGAALTTIVLSNRLSCPGARRPSPHGETNAPPSPSPLPLRQACGKGILYGIVAVILVQVVTMVVNLLLERLGISAGFQPVVDLLLSHETAAPIKFALCLQSIVVAPVLEELFFRFTLLPSLAAATGSIGRAILYSTLFFALLHGSLLGFLPLALFSILCSIAYLATGRLATPVTTHVLFNASGVILILLMGL